MSDDFRPGPEFRRAVDHRTRQLSRRRTGFVGVAAASVIAAGVALPLALTSGNARTTVKVLTAPSTVPSTATPIPTTTPPATTPTSAPTTTTRSPLLFRPVYCVIPAYSPPSSNTVTTVPTPPPPSQADCAVADATQLPTTPPSQDVASRPVILPADPKSYGPASHLRYVLGPADLTGTAVADAVAVAGQGASKNSVQVTLTPQGAVQFDRIAASRYACYVQDSTNPPPCSQEAFDLNGQVEGAPSFQAANFHGSISITGVFTPSQASTLAHEIKYGSSS